MPVLQDLVVDELKRTPPSGPTSDCHCGVEDEKAFVARMEKAFETTKGRVAELVEDATYTAEHAWKRGQHACEDVIEETNHTVKKFPIPALGIAFAAGALLGALIPRSFPRKP